MLALAALLCLAAFAPASALAGSISGIVTDAVTHEPIADVEVCAWPFIEEAESSGCTRTAADGSYAIGGLEAGKYRVEFWAGSLYEFEFYDDTPKWSEAALVAVGGGETSGIDAELQPRPAIKGTVLAEGTGLRIEGVEVCAWPFPEDEENLGECDWTAADGSYAMGVEPGSYKIEFWPGFPSPNFAFQVYDHTVQWANADLVSVAEGEWKTGIDADLPIGGTISGNVLDIVSGAGVEEARVCSIEAASGLLVTCTWTNELGNYTLRHFPPGNYKMVFSPDLREWFPNSFPEDDGYPTQFWNNQTTLTAANVIPMPLGGSAPGINAQYGLPAPVVTPPVTSPPVKPKPRKKKCPRGKKRKKINGKVRCVKVRKHRKHRRSRHRVSFSGRHEGQRLLKAGYWRHCGDQNGLGAGWYNVRAHNINCGKARRVARTYTWTSNDEPLGFSCQKFDVGSELNRVACMRVRGGRLVQKVRFQYGS